MDTSTIAQIAALQRMTVAELQQAWLRLYAEPSRSRNRRFLFRRLAWRIQELQLGGLSDRAKSRIDELAADGFTRARTPSGTLPEGDRSISPQAQLKKRRDPSLPPAGSVISKTYKETELRVTVRDDGFEYDGAMYLSLTALAKKITGCTSINGKLFFGLAQRKRKH